MATQIHAFGPNGELSPGAEAALEGLGGGGGGATALGDLTDVDTTGATTGQVLTFDGSEWSPDAPSAGTVTSTSISDSTDTGRAVLTAADAATARSAIGAGTSNLAIGTTAGTAAEGNDSRIVNAVPSSRTINAKPLTDNIVLDADDVGARPDDWLPGVSADSGNLLTLGSDDLPMLDPGDVPAGGGSGFVFPIDEPAIDPTYGDHFTGASLDAKWTRVNLTSTEESYQQGARGSHLRVDMSGGAAFRGYTQPLPVGDFEAILSFAQRTVSTSPPIFGLALLASNDSGRGMFVYNNPMAFAGSINAGGAYGSASGSIGGQGGSTGSAGTMEGQRIWLRVRRIGSDADFSSSFDGETWHQHQATAIGPVTKVGIVRVFNSPATHIVHIDRFDMRSI